MFKRARVENNVDERGLQYVQVRILGLHSFSESDVPTESLPWAEPLLPPTEGKVNGGYGKADVPDIGDWVAVIFEESDVFKSKPMYLGIIRSNNDGVGGFSPGQNAITNDRFGNNTKISKGEQKYNDSLGNVLLKNNDGEFYKDSFNNFIALTKDTILINTKKGNGIKIDEKNSKIIITTKSKGTITIKDDSEIDIRIGKSEINLDADGEIFINTKDGRNEQIDFYKFMTLFNTHTHMLGPTPTTPPSMLLDIFEHTRDSYYFSGILPVNNLKITKNSDHVAEDDPPGTIYPNSVIHPDTILADKYSVESTKLMNGSTNPSTDEYAGARNMPSLAPKYTGEVLTIGTFYSRGKIIGKGEIVQIQGKAVYKKIAEIVYQMILDSQKYNMVDRLKLLEKSGDVYIVTEKGAKELKNEDGEYYKKDDPFPMTEDYQNNICTYSLVIVNSGFRSNTEPIIDPETNKVLCVPQLYFRKKYKTRKMTDHELMTLSSTRFSPYVAIPGYSKHQNGTAIDFNTRGGGQNAWLIANRGKYKFKRTVPSELWHHVYYGD